MIAALEMESVPYAGSHDIIYIASVALQRTDTDSAVLTVLWKERHEYNGRICHVEPDRRNH